MNEFLQTWQDPHARHAALVHLPVVLGALGAAPLVALACTRFKNATLKWVCVVWFALASAGAALAASAGEDAADGVEHTGAHVTPAEHAALERHEDLGDGGWMWPLIPAALVALTFVPRRAVAVASGSLAIAAGVGVAVWIALTAHAGGRLVYVYGLGVPARGDAAVSPAGERAAPGAERD